MKLLLVAEGASELGSEGPGALETLVRRILAGTELEIESAKVQWKDLPKLHGKGKGYFKRAIQWMKHAQESGYEAMVLLIDRDHVDIRVNELNEAQENSLFPLPRALGVAVETFDAWMLADEAALSKVLNRKIDTQPNPESLKDPKARLQELFEEGQSASYSNLYARITEELDLDVLKKRCPHFNEFAERVLGLAK